jgi:hypothetical protein
MGKSKTNVSSRQEAKNRRMPCRFCGADKPRIVMMFQGGKKVITRKCCEEAGYIKVKGSYVKKEAIHE